MPSQSDVRKRRLHAETRPAGGGLRLGSRRDRKRRMIVGLVAVVVATMMVASLAVGLLSVF